MYSFLTAKRFFLPLIAWGIASVKFYLKALCFVFHTTVRSPWYAILVQKVLSKQARSWNLIGLTNRAWPISSDRALSNDLRIEVT